MDNIRAFVEELTASRKKAENLLDLNDDCLHHMCLLMDLRSLLAMSGTCSRLKTIAYNAFEVHKITEICYYPGGGDMHRLRNNGPILSHNAVMVYEPSEFDETMKYFGEFLTRVRFCKRGYTMKELSQLLAFRGNDLELVLEYYGRFRRESVPGPAESIDISPLFAQLTTLSLRIHQPETGTQKPLPLPFDACNQLEELAIHKLDVTNLRRCLSSKFPKLQRFSLYDLGTMKGIHVDRFIKKNPQLTSCLVHGDDTNKFRAFGQLKHLESLDLCRVDEGTGQVIGQMPLKNLTLRWVDSVDRLHAFVDGATVLHRTLKCLRLDCRNTALNNWPNFQQFRTLRSLICFENRINSGFQSDLFAARIRELTNAMPWLEKMWFRVDNTIHCVGRQYKYKLTHGLLNVWTSKISCYAEFQKYDDDYVADKED